MGDDSDLPDPAEEEARMLAREAVISLPVPHRAHLRHHRGSQRVPASAGRRTEIRRALDEADGIATLGLRGPLK
jgi:hypothetical protein